MRKSVRLLRGWVPLRDAIPAGSVNRCRIPCRAAGQPATYPRFDHRGIMSRGLKPVRVTYRMVTTFAMVVAVSLSAESYDSDPPIEEVAKNDFNVSTSLGWKRGVWLA